MAIKPIHRALLAALIICAAFAQINDVAAQALESSVTVETQINQDSASSQNRVSDLSRQTQDLLSEYRAVVRETESLKIYNDNLQKVVDDQHSEEASINRQLAGLEETNRGVIPLMLEMIDSLARIVEARYSVSAGAKAGTRRAPANNDGPG